MELVCGTKRARSYTLSAQTFKCYPPHISNNLIGGAIDLKSRRQKYRYKKIIKLVVKQCGFWPAFSYIFFWGNFRNFKTNDEQNQNICTIVAYVRNYQIRHPPASEGNPPCTTYVRTFNTSYLSCSSCCCWFTRTFKWRSVGVATCGIFRGTGCINYGLIKFPTGHINK